MSGMATADRYSRIVLWLKVVLPLLALGILSTLFFVAETLDPEAAIPYADVDVEKILREQGVTRPTFGGVTSGGATIALFADEVRPTAEQQDRLIARTMEASIDLPSGTRITIDSATGIVDATAQMATLQDGARLESSLGYVVETEKIIASLSNTSVVAPGNIRADGPAGQLTAGRMELTRTETPEPAYLLVFKNGVRLVYTPNP